MNNRVPPQEAIDAAVEIGRQSPCAKSKRGVVIFARHVSDQVLIYSRGYNSPPAPFVCDGSEACQGACAKVAEHAEAAALRLLGGTMAAGLGLELLHVKVRNGELVESGPPSCSDCSKAILADRRIWRVWLLHESGWTGYGPVDFHALSLIESERPVILPPEPNPIIGIHVRGHEHVMYIDDPRRHGEE